MLLAVSKHLNTENRSIVNFDNSLVTPLVTNIWCSALVAMLAIILISSWDFLKHLSSIFSVAALFMVYVAFLRGAKRGVKSPQTLFLAVSIEDDLMLLAPKTIIMLSFALLLQMLFFGLPSRLSLSSVTLGMCKAGSWHFTILSARSTSWSIATTIGTFSLLATRNPFQQSSELQAMGHVLLSLVTLGQTILTVPKPVSGRMFLWGLALVPIVPYLANECFITHQQSIAPTSFGKGLHEHPVDGLIRRANLDFERLRQRQSRTFAEAWVEYRRRYGNDPPPGFEAWYEFAVANDSPIIDDFDTLYASIAPFWKVRGDDVVRGMEKIQHTTDSEVWRCSASKAVANISCSHAFRKFDRHISLLFNELFADIPEPHFEATFLVNHLDEPRVMLPENMQHQQSHSGIELTNKARKPIWDILTRSCPPLQDTGRAFPVETFGLPFVTNSTASMDLCQHPEYRELHGLLMSPTSFRLVEGMAPVLSTGAPSTMGDILFPSPAYMEDEFQYDESSDIAWEEKHNRLYWAGSTTGGFATDGGWTNYHRQRFVSLAQNLGLQKHAYLEEKKPGVIQRTVSSFLNGRLFDVAFTRVFHCETRQCRDESAFFGTRSWAHKDEALRSRLVFDIDGNSISGRYYKLLASGSTPLKQTIFREWHDDRLVPWVHYVPVSQSLEELPELVFYLTSTENGQRRAREIAENGREWFSRAFRKVDQSIYVYRLMLELARLQDPMREPI